MAVDDCKVIQLPKIVDPRGNLTFVEGERHIPFAIKRVFYLYDVPGGETRGGHAHKQLHQFMIAVAGSFDVRLDDGQAKRSVTLNRSFFGLHVPPMTWVDMDDFSSGSVCLVLASEAYSEADYVRDHATFLALVGR